jgi:hypothetical protein
LEYRRVLLEEPVPEPEPLLRIFLTIDVDESPVPEPLAVLGAVCRPSVASEPFPEAFAVLGDVLNDVKFAEPVPSPLAVRGAVCKPSAVSPAVAPPVPVAPLSFPYLNVADEPDCPNAEPVR